MKVERKKTSDSLFRKNSNKSGKGGNKSVSSVDGVSSVANIKNRNFIDSLSMIEEIKSKDELKEIFDKIVEAGEIFKNTPIFSHLTNYKSLLQKFMAKIIKDSYEVDSVTSQRIDRDDKVLTIVKTIDKNLEELSEELLTKQKDILKLASKVDEIKGLLLDLIF